MKKISLMGAILPFAFIIACASTEGNEENGIKAVKQQQQADELLRTGPGMRQLEAPRLPSGSVR